MSNVYSTLIEYEDLIGRDISIEEAINVLYEDVKKRNMFTNFGLSSVVAGGLMTSVGKMRNMDLDKKLKGDYIEKAAKSMEDKKIPGLDNGKWYSDFRKWMEEILNKKTHDENVLKVQEFIQTSREQNNKLMRDGVMFSISGILLMILGILYHRKVATKDKTKVKVIDANIQNAKKALQITSK